MSTVKTIVVVAIGLVVLAMGFWLGTLIARPAIPECNGSHAQLLCLSD